MGRSCSDLSVAGGMGTWAGKRIAPVFVRKIAKEGVSEYFSLGIEG